jgi:GAF domain-containing protein/HAMP domain-containing protein
MQTNQPSFRYFELAPDQSEMEPNRRSLYRLLQAALAYIPLLLTFNALGFVVIYSLGQLGLLDASDVRLLYVAGVSFAVGLLHVPLYGLLRKGSISAVAIALLVINGLGAGMQILFWDNILWFPLAMVVSLALVFVAQRGLGIWYRLGSFLFGVGTSALLIYLDTRLPYTRMDVSSSLSHTAGLALYIIIIFAMVVLVMINSVINFHAIASRLVTTFTFIAFLSAIITLIISALANLYYDRQRVFQELNAATVTKASQINITLSNLENDTNLYLSDALIEQRIQYLLANPADSLLYNVNYDLVRAYLLKQKAQTTKYEEFLFIDGNGKTLISTNPTNNNSDFSSFAFFKNGLSGVNATLEYGFPHSPQSTYILVVKPIMVNGVFKGALAARVSLAAIREIMVTETGLGKTAETYLVAQVQGKTIPITSIRQVATEINTLATQSTLIEHRESGSAIYLNYAGQSVLGSYLTNPTLQIALVAEVEQQEIVQNIFKVLLSNLVFGLFTSLLAFMIVLVTSRSISMPLVNLADKANALANGELSTRISVNRQDEIGALASSFNTMASELQSLVKTLEQKVEDRTQDLQKQANYLRLASEVARDSANARNLDELLNQAAQLILDRFGFYHTGIFLLDAQDDYAILRASPTESGKAMVARQHKLKVGQEGIVGYVAATGKPRIALDTGLDAAYFNNPLLPMTRSELAMPLKVNEQLLGVLDVQSEQPEAFTQDDIATLQIMADQLALAIQRARLAEEQERSLHELEVTSRQFTVDNWQAFSQEADFKPGYKFDGMQITPLNAFSEESQVALNQGRTLIVPPAKSKSAAGATLIVPMKLRDQIIGALSIQFNIDLIPAETISLIEETATRLAIALDNARLYTETQKFAERERTVSGITARITSSVNFENILRTFVQELGSRLPNSEVTVQLKKNQG